MPDEVARIGALSNGSNGQRSLESASLHFEPICRRQGGAANRELAGEILSAAKYLLCDAEPICRDDPKNRGSPLIYTDNIDR
jgi:hypothetical protein